MTLTEAQVLQAIVLDGLVPLLVIVLSVYFVYMAVRKLSHMI